MLTHNTISCCYEGCYATITLHPDDERRLRKTHEGFYCPAGHIQYFLGKTAQEKEIAQLEKQVDRLRETNREWIRDLGEARERLSRIARAVQVCPLGCGWQGNRRVAWQDGGGDGRFLDRVGQDMANHLAQEHGTKVKVVDGRLVAPEVEVEA